MCVSCEKIYPWQETDCGHFLENTERSKTFGGNKLWFHPLNFGAQCTKCNRFNAASAKQFWTEKFIKMYGIEKIEEMRKMRDTPYKWTREEIEEKINSYEKSPQG